MSRRASVRLYALHSLLSRLYFFLPILVLWFLSQGFSQFQVTILLSAFFLSTTLAEVPTGLFSDRFGHKWAMAFCGLFQAAGVLLLAFASHFGIAMAGELLMGIGQAFYTGSKEAYLFNVLEEEASHHLYQRDYAQAKFFEFIGMAVGSLVGGSVYVLSARLPFFLSALAFLLAAVIAGLLQEPNKKEASPPVTWNQLARGYKAIRHGPKSLRRLLAYYCFLFSTILIFIVILIQPYLKMIGLPIHYFGIAFFLFQAASMGGSLVARRLPHRWLGSRFFFFLALTLSLALGGLAQLHPPIVFLLIGTLYFVWGLFLPTTSQATNQLIRSEIRATVLSTQDFIQNLIFVMIAPILGMVTDHGGMSVSLGILSLVALLNAFLIMGLKRQSE